MNDVCAFIVGIDRYDQGGRWDLKGPCANAIDVAQWLLSIDTPKENIFLFLEPTAENREGTLGKAKKLGVTVNSSVSSYELDTFWRKRLRVLSTQTSRFFFYWSGHGVLDNNQDRVFFCSDYEDGVLTDRVFNCTKVLLHLRAPDYLGFTEQLCFFDVCAAPSTVELDSRTSAPANPSHKTKQAAYFATRAGEYAKSRDERGVFTQATLEALKEIKGWPDFEALAKRMQKAFASVEQEMFHIEYLQRSERVWEQAGKLPEDRENPFYKLVYPMLSGIQIPDSVYRPHFLRTVSVLGEPGLSRAQVLSQMLRELCRLKARREGEVPSGLLQFLLRLRTEQDLEAPIDDWLKANASQQGNELETLREKLARESELKVIVVDVANDNDGELESFQLFVRTSDLRPLPGVASQMRKVSDWDQFCTELGDEIEHLRETGLIDDFEAHFLVDPPLFDRPFHAIRIAGGITIGEDHVVVVRHRSRVRSASRVLRDAWRKYTNALRENKPVELKLLSVPSEAGTQPELLPADKGFCYMDFVVQAGAKATPGISVEKVVLQKLLRRGAPYLYWLHSPPAGGLATIEPELRQWLSELKTLDDFPAVFTEKRVNENALASEATLLWDDPEFNPFRNKRGVTVK